MEPLAIIITRLIRKVHTKNMWPRLFGIKIDYRKTNAIESNKVIAFIRSERRLKHQNLNKVQIIHKLSVYCYWNYVDDFIIKFESGDVRTFIELTNNHVYMYKHRSNPNTMNANTSICQMSSVPVTCDRMLALYLITSVINLFVFSCATFQTNDGISLKSLTFFAHF